MSWPEAILGCVAAVVIGAIFWKAMDFRDDDD